MLGETLSRRTSESFLRRLMARWPVGNILTWRQQADATAVLWKYRYDPADQLTSAVKHATDTPETVLKRYAYAYDPAGNRTVEQIDDAVTLSTYDHLNRLTSQAPGGPLVIAGSLNEPGTVTISGVAATVDAGNNFRGTVPTTSGTNTFTIVAKDSSGNTTTNQYEVSLSGSTKTFTYDANGNLTADGNRSFSWNARNELAEAAVSGVTTSLSYNGLRQRVHLRVTEGGSSASQEYIWCEFIKCEGRSGGAISRFFSHGDFTGAAERYLVRDHLSSTRALTTDTAGLQSHVDFDPSGRLVAGSPGQSAGYTSHELLGQLGLWSSYYRLYDPALGRWLSEDPIGLEGGSNMYAYVHNQTVSAIDPLGLKISCVTGFQEQQVKVTKCGAGFDGCTSGAPRTVTLDCERDRCSNQWKFDAQVTLRLLVEYSGNRNGPSLETPGSTLRQHEMLHVRDLQGWCRGLNSRFPSEGFSTRPACIAARDSFERSVRHTFNQAAADSGRRRDGKK